MKFAVLRQEKYPALLGIPRQPAQTRSGPVCPAYIVHAAPTLHFFIRYLHIIHFLQNGVNTVLDVDCHSMLYLFYGFIVLNTLLFNGKICLQTINIRFRDKNMLIVKNTFTI